MKSTVLLAAVLLCIRSGAAATASHTHKHKTVVHAATPAMAPERATQIQTALIKAGYLTGEPSGTWDAASNAAMQKYQGDNGWQTKFTPDARALNKLGLGTPTTTAAAN